MNARRRVPSVAERALFAHAMAGVRRLDPDAAAPSSPPPRPVAPPSEPPLRPPARTLPRLEPGGNSGIDARTAARLKRGRIRPEARLDLHGMTLEEAHRAVAGFIGRCAGARLRCVIVITGKGRLGETSGTLRTELPRWLALSATRAHVLAFAEARPRDGGAGACYILLRRAPKADRGRS